MERAVRSPRATVAIALATAAIASAAGWSTTAATTPPPTPEPTAVPADPTATATLPTVPGETIVGDPGGPVADPIDFLRERAETTFAAEHPTTSAIACELPDATGPGTQFNCYGVLPDGSVVVKTGTVNDYGTVEFTTPATGDTPGSQPSGGGDGEPIELNGVDAQVVALPTPITGPTILVVERSGASDVTVHPRLGGAEVGEPLIVTTANEQATFLIGLDGTVDSFAVTATGPWQLTVEGATTGAIALGDGGAEGAGPDVVRYTAAEPFTLPVRIDGGGDVTITVVAAGGRNTLLGDNAPLEAQLDVPAGPGYLLIDAVGTWALGDATSRPPSTAVG